MATRTLSENSIVVSFERRKRYIKLGTWEKRRDKYDSLIGTITYAPTHRIVCESAWGRHNWQPLPQYPDWQRCSNCESDAIVSAGLTVINMAFWFESRTKQNLAAEKGAKNETKI